MRFVFAAVAVVLTAPLALASHAVNEDPLGIYDEEGLNLSQTCGETLFENADPFPPVPLRYGCDTPNFLVQAASDGYVLAIQRMDDTTFTVKVRHALPLRGAHLPVALDLVPLRLVDLQCSEAADCGGNGFYVHGATAASGDDLNPLSGAFPPQRITAAPDGSSWTIVVPGAPHSPVYVTVIGVVALSDGTTVRGFYNPLKLAAPVDLLDAQPYPTLL